MTTKIRLARLDDPPAGGAAIMEKRLGSSVNEITGVSIRPDTGLACEFKAKHRVAIDAHWAEAVSRNAHLWNGRTMKLIHYRLDNGRFSGK